MILLKLVKQVQYCFANADLPSFADLPWRLNLEMRRSVVTLCALDQQYFQLNYLPVKSSETDISVFFQEEKYHFESHHCQYEFIL